MVLQSVRRTATCVTTDTGELLPHLFTLTRRRSFSATLLYPHEHLPIQKHGALHCPDFPLQPIDCSDRPACYRVQNYYFLFNLVWQILIELNQVGIFIAQCLYLLKLLNCHIALKSTCRITEYLVFHPELHHIIDIFKMT